MPDRAYPLSLLVLGNVRLGASEYEEQSTTSRLIQDIMRADQNRISWIQRQQALTRLRYGVRKKRNFPWPNASNLSIPLIDSQIRRMKPLLAKLIVQPDPVVEFVGEDPDAVEAERKAESEYNWLFKTHMNAIEPLLYTIDGILHRGFSFVQIGWEYQTEYSCRVVLADQLFPQGLPPGIDAIQIAAMLAKEYNLDPRDPKVASSLKIAGDKLAAGAPAVKLAFKEVISDRPALYDRDPVQVIAPPRTTDHGNAEWVCIQHLFSGRKLKQLEADGTFKRGSVAKILGDLKNATARRSGTSAIATGSTSLDTESAEADARERIWGIEDEDNILIWEVFHWFDHDGDGLADRVTSFLHPQSNTLLSCRPYAYPFRRWPIVKVDFEKTSRRFHSPRGISAMLEGLNRETNAQHNARIDAMTLHNAPTYQTPVLAGFKAKNFRVSPGTVLQMPLGAKIEPILQDRGSFQTSVAEEQLLRTIAEGYIGTFDNTLTNAADNRTATEVNAAVQLAASTASLDTIIFQLAMREIHTLIWELWMDLRPENVSYKVTGNDPNSNEQQLITVPKSEINKRFKLFPTGTIANTNHALELSNAREAMNFFVPDQTGYINQYELRRYFLGLLDPRIARKILNPPAAAQHLQILQQAAAAVSKDPGLAAGLGSPVPSEVPQESPEILNVQPSA